MGDDAPVVPRQAPGWKFWARILVSVALLGVLVLKAPNPDELLPNRHHLLTALLLSAALLMTVLGVILSAWRWQRVLFVFDARVSLRPLIGHYFAGQFVGNVLPSTIGGDVLRVSRASTTVDSSPIAFGSVVLERLTGFVALPLLVFTGFAIRPSLIDVDRAWITLAHRRHHARRPGARPVPRRPSAHRRPLRRTRELDQVHRRGARRHRPPPPRAPATDPRAGYRDRVPTLRRGHRRTHLPHPRPAGAARGNARVRPAVAMLQVLPLSFNGLGVREGALVLFLHPLGRQQRASRSPRDSSGSCAR